MPQLPQGKQCTAVVQLLYVSSTRTARQVFLTVVATGTFSGPLRLRAVGRPISASPFVCTHALFGDSRPGAGTASVVLSYIVYLPRVDSWSE